MQIHELKCFGAAPGDGNPALVIEADDSTAAARQAFARARNSTCVYIDERDGRTVLDYFYPHTRSPLCLHATLAAARVLLADQPANSLSFPRRRNGVRNKSWLRRSDLCWQSDPGKPRLKPT